MAGLNNHVLHWRPEENRWVAIGWDRFCAFRERTVYSRRHLFANAKQSERNGELTRGSPFP